jgi:hypothetical protein
MPFVDRLVLGEVAIAFEVRSHGVKLLDALLYGVQFVEDGHW